jgi:hypothetical protein
VFVSNTLTVSSRQVHRHTRAINALANSQRRAGPGEGINHDVARLGAGLDAPFDKTLIELGLVPFPSLLGIANHTGEVKRIALTEVEHVAGDSPSGIGSLVAHLLTLRLNPNSIRIQRRVLRAESPKRSVVVPKVVLVVLSKREHLDARFAFDGGEATPI